MRKQKENRKCQEMKFARLAFNLSILQKKKKNVWPPSSCQAEPWETNPIKFVRWLWSYRQNTLPTIVGLHLLLNLNLFSFLPPCKNVRKKLWHVTESISKVVNHSFFKIMLQKSTKKTSFNGLILVVFFFFFSYFLLFIFRTSFIIS